MLALMVVEWAGLKGVCVWWSLEGLKGSLRTIGVMFRQGWRLGLG